MADSKTKNYQSLELATPLWVALCPLIFLMVALGFNVHTYGNESLSGANQIALMMSAAVTSVLAMCLGYDWNHIQEKILDNIRSITAAIVILLLVGALTGAWLISGIVPAMIYYGLEVFNPSIFIVSATLISALAGIMIGSSWSTSATIGVTLMGIGSTLGFNPGLVAGAVISGAYFGDKLSPLSDTTNLASGVSNVELFSHIRYLTYTTVPSFIITLLFFAVVTIFMGTGDQHTSSESMQLLLQKKFNLNPLLMLVPVSVIILIVKRTPAIPALFIGVLLGVIAAFIFQDRLLQELAEKLKEQEYGAYKTVMLAIYGDISIDSDNPVLNKLLQTAGMSGMLTTIWLIISAMLFGGAMEASGFLKIITNFITRGIKSLGGLVSSTVGICVLSNVAASDQYLSVVVPGRMFVQSYIKRGISLKNLSRSLEDGGTVTSVLVPWNTCGAYHASVLGVATLAYAPWTLFCIISPLMSILFAYANIKIATDTEVDQPDSAS